MMPATATAWEKAEPFVAVDDRRQERVVGHDLGGVVDHDLDAGAGDAAAMHDVGARRLAGPFVPQWHQARIDGHVAFVVPLGSRPVGEIDFRARGERANLIAVAAHEDHGRDRVAVDECRPACLGGRGEREVLRCDQLGGGGERLAPGVGGRRARGESRVDRRAQVGHRGGRTQPEGDFVVSAERQLLDQRTVQLAVDGVAPFVGAAAQQHGVDGAAVLIDGDPFDATGDGVENALFVDRDAEFRQLPRRFGKNGRALRRGQQGESDECRHENSEGRAFAIVALLRLRRSCFCPRELGRLAPPRCRYRSIV